LRAKNDRERLLSQIEKMQAEIDRLADDNKNLATRLAAHEPKESDQDKADGPASERSVWWYVGGGVLAAIVLGAGAFVGTRLLNEKSDADSPPDDQPPASGEREPTEGAGS
jgi:hypothetical protein